MTNLNTTQQELNLVNSYAERSLKAQLFKQVLKTIDQEAKVKEYSKNTAKILGELTEVKKQLNYHQTEIDKSISLMLLIYLYLRSYQTYFYFKERNTKKRELHSLKRIHAQHLLNIQKLLQSKIKKDIVIVKPNIKVHMKYHNKNSITVEKDNEKIKYSNYNDYSNFLKNYLPEYFEEYKNKLID